ncbi:MAG: copper-binding protein [Deltaproteobacteria bacterium]|jgi:Cu/Ag efflux protein CusF|nr:copper-binding protein [Deltaproteobacteria bacterium]
MSFFVHLSSLSRCSAISRGVQSVALAAGRRPSPLFSRRPSAASNRLKNVLLAGAVLAAALWSLTSAAPVWAQHHDHGHGHGAPAEPAVKAPASPQGVYSAVGRVVSLSLETGEVVLDHGPIPAVNWPAMVMGFSVEDPALLDGLVLGDEVRFDVKFEGDSYYLVDLEKVD